MPRLLDAYAGSGGAAMGYHRAGFEVEGVDNNKARIAEYPFKCHYGDAIGFILEHGHEFDAVHTSPPCTGYTQATSAIPDRINKYDRLIGATRAALEEVGGVYVIENVVSKITRAELRDPLMLCWSMFHTPGSVLDDDGTPLQMRRHRLFESNVPLMPPATCHHPSGIQFAGSYSGSRRDKDEARLIRKGGYVPKSLDVQRALLGTPWMDEKGCQLSIPPAYTEHIGAQLLDHLARECGAA